MTQDPHGGQDGSGERPPAGPPSHGQQPPQPPAYGTPPGPPSYGQQPPPPPPSYGQPPAGQPPYGQPPQYGQPPAGGPPQYGAPQQQYGTPPPPYGQPPQQPYGGPAAQRPPLRPEEEKQWAMFAHLGGLLGILPSLIIYLVYKDRGPFVREQSREALNFQITMLIAYIVAIFVSIVLSALFWTPFGLRWLVWIVSAVFSVIAGMAANRGENYRYPFALRVVS